MCISSLDTSCMALNSLSATAPASALAMMDAIAEICSGEASSSSSILILCLYRVVKPEKVGLAWTENAERSSPQGKFCLRGHTTSPTSLNSSHNNGGAEFFFFSTFRFRRRI